MEHSRHNSVEGGDGESPTPLSDLIREDDLKALPEALGFRVVTEPRLGIARVTEPAGV